MPERIQLSRRRGWRLPPGAVSVARPGWLGNPFSIAHAVRMSMATPATAAAFVVACHREWLQAPPGASQHWQGRESEIHQAKVLSRLHQLRGRDLACWCAPGAPCHADTLLELANRPLLCERVAPRRDIPKSAEPAHDRHTATESTTTNP
jgi:hypothetical protein